MEDKVKAFLEAEIAEKQARIAVDNLDLARIKAEFEAIAAQKQAAISIVTKELVGLERLLSMHLGMELAPLPRETKVEVEKPEAPIAKEVVTVRLHEPYGYRNIILLLARAIFKGGNFTTRQMVDAITQQQWKVKDDDHIKSKHVTDVLAKEEDFFRVSRKSRHHVYRLADKHMQT